MNKTIVYTTGVFDILHTGHFNVLTKAAELGDNLIVGILDSDECLKIKGSRPILNNEERKQQLLSLPFVKDVIIYKSLDQRTEYGRIKPDVIVQGDDWIHTADRKDALDFFRERNIRLILVPRTEGVSTTELKKRLSQDNRKDIDALKQLKLLPIASLSKYERFNEEKVQKLVEKIKSENTFFNPITVGEVDDLSIVIDGANRLEALERLGAKYVTAVVFPYLEVDLQANVHFIKKGKVTRLSEFSTPDDWDEKIECAKYTHQDIIEAIKEKRTIRSGVTWHRPNKAIIRVRVSLDNLMQGFDFETYVNTLIENNDIRYYPANVYICDEWHK